MGGIDLRDIPRRQLMDQISFVFQNSYLFSNTIAANIRFGRPDADKNAMIAAAKAAQAHDFIMSLPNGYATRFGSERAALSGGQRQRLTIAHAILKDAPIVILDEATAAIDPTTERALQQAFAELVQDKTLIVVAHKLSTIEAADQIIVLDDGQIVERGDHAAPINHGGLYAGLWNQRRQAQSWQISS
jgi:ATP-binding cassette subfamily B protein